MNLAITHTGFNTLRATVCAVLLMSLSGCSILPKAEPVVFYRLPPVLPSQDTSTQPALAMVVRIKQPDSSGLLASNRIAVIPKDNQLSAYQGARWAVNVPVLFRDHIMDAWLQSGRIQHIISDSKPLAADRELAGSLRAFQSEYRQGKPMVVVHYDAQWIDPNTRTLLASRRFSVTEPAEHAEVSAVITAFGVAQAHLAKALLSWVIAVESKE